MSIVLRPEEARALIARALVANRTSEQNAETVARALVAAEADGQGGHGFARVLAYAAQAKAGKVDGHARPSTLPARPGLLRVDAANGFAYSAIDLAIERLIPIAREQGIACATIHRSHHAGQLGAHVERLAEAGLVALMVANAPASIAPWGARRPLYGTNPIAFAAPVPGQPPLVIDLSISRVARGKVMAASQRGEPIPEGWALDPDGNPTTDADAALAGTMIPVGEAKGAALALMVEVLAASLTGAMHSFESTSFFDAEGAPPAVGQTIIAIDPETASGGAYAERIAALMEAFGECEGARLPGTSRLAAREKAEREGLFIRPELHELIVALANGQPG